MMGFCAEPKRLRMSDTSFYTSETLKDRLLRLSRSAREPTEARGPSTSPMIPHFAQDDRPCLEHALARDVREVL